ncbi:hypothetical protein FACS189490_03690 [Clostridia bacterium]|nr:hypothetical protein FACS189490_03630 [Clostridia bacterium]GHV39682.1 hypothetical protein FACS189490_03690 [Clostridia bacterium]
MKIAMVVLSGAVFLCSGALLVVSITYMVKARFHHIRRFTKVE